MDIKKALTYLGWPVLLLPTLVLYLGAGMNEAVVWANGGQMPVSAYSCQVRMDAKTAANDGTPDYVHKCADKNTRLRWLDDWMLGDDGIASLGDLLQETASTLNYVVYPLWFAGCGLAIVRRKYPKSTD
jgi:hypothetical protein